MSDAMTEQIRKRVQGERLSYLRRMDDSSRSRERTRIEGWIGRHAAEIEEAYTHIQKLQAFKRPLHDKEKVDLEFWQDLFNLASEQLTDCKEQIDVLNSLGAGDDLDEDTE